MELRTQCQVEQWMRWLWSLVAVVSTLAAYLQDDQSIAWIALFFTAVITFILVVPDWPFWNRRVIQWKGVVQPSSSSSQQQRTKAS